MEMQLAKLYIERLKYGSAKGQLEGRIEFAGPYGNVTIPLDETLSLEIVKLCAAGITRMSRQIAEELTADVVEGTVALPAPTTQST